MSNRTVTLVEIRNGSGAVHEREIPMDEEMMDALLSAQAKRRNLAAWIVCGAKRGQAKEEMAK